MTLPTNEGGRPRRRPGPVIEAAPRAGSGGIDGSGRDRETRRELAKLTATFLNGVAIAIFAVGGLAPLVAVLSGQLVVADGPLVASLCATAFAVSVVAHRLALYVIAKEFRR